MTDPKIIKNVYSILDDVAILIGEKEKALILQYLKEGQLDNVLRKIADCAKINRLSLSDRHLDFLINTSIALGQEENLREYFISCKNKEYLTDTDTYPRVKKLLNENIRVSSGEGSNEAAIQAAQEQLGLQFPESFKSYLKDFGTLDIDSREVFGLLLSDEKEIDNIVWHTKDLRDNYGLDHDLIPIGGLGDGSYDYLKCGLNGEDLGVFLMEYIEPDAYKYKLADSFPYYLEQLYNSIFDEEDD